MNAMTAAHRALPLNSVVRVTNLRKGAWTLVRITDRGPFVESRVVDLRWRPPRPSTYGVRGRRR